MIRILDNWTTFTHKERCEIIYFHTWLLDKFYNAKTIGFMDQVEYQFKTTYLQPLKTTDRVERVLEKVLAVAKSRVRMKYLEQFQVIEGYTTDPEVPPPNGAELVEITIHPDAKVIFPKPLPDVKAIYVGDKRIEFSNYFSEKRGYVEKKYKRGGFLGL